MAVVELKIHGLDCVEEVGTLRAELGPLPGVEALEFNILEGRMSVRYEEDQITPDDLIAGVERTGLSAEPFAAAQPNRAEGFPQRVARIAPVAVSGALIAAGLLVHASLGGWKAALGLSESAGTPLAATLLYAAAALTAGWRVVPKAWASLRRMRPDINLLMTLAVLGALAIGEPLEAAAVAFLFAISLALESWSVSRARRAVAALLTLAPAQARVVDPQGAERLVAAAHVAVGARIVIKPGERVPLDAQIVEGETTVDQSAITGESLPVARRPGDELYAGSVNHEGAIEAVVLKPATQSVLAQIIKLVREAQSKRSPSEQWVETFARYYTPVVIAAAIVLGLITPLVAGNFEEWFYRALVLLVIACPCALVISTPVAVVAALTSAAHAGVLIKGGRYVELPSRIRAVAIDKTGTLTEGRLEVQAAAPLAGHTRRELIEIASAIERRSEHPLAQAIVRQAEREGIFGQPGENYQALRGKGATATLAGRAFWIGSHRLLQERGQEDLALREQLNALAAGGSSIVVVGEEEHVCGFIALADKLRDHAKEAVAALKAEGVEHVVLLTGDNRATAAAIAEASGADEFRAELLPQEKVAAIEELVARFGSVAMVGDGVNDAPALARATLGIAMGHIGADATLETADVVLMGDDLRRLPWLVRHSRRTLRIIRQNVAVSLAVKLLFMGLTLAGHASLWSAIAADMGTSLLVIFNGLRLLRAEPLPGDQARGVAGRT